MPDNEYHKIPNAPVTIQDIAQLADVSIATVSRYLHGHLNRMSAETAARIDRIIKENNYVPNKVAQNLKQKTSSTIGIMVANVDDIFSIELYKGAEEYLFDVGYELVLINSNSDANREQQLLKDLRNRQLAGLLIQPVQNKLADFTELKELGLPTMVLDRHFDHHYWPVIESNNEEISRELGQLIIDKGYEEVIIVTEPVAATTSRQLRVKGICEKVESAGLITHVIEVDETHFDGEAVHDKIGKLTNHRQTKTALVALREPLFLQLVGLKIRKNVKYPQQMGIVGYADTAMINILDPDLTLVRQKPIEIGRVAAQMLVAQIKNETLAEEMVYVSAEIIEGTSL
ncbi:LacI family DNA-binding transcriptional regulator [Periweissella fabalis]|uniref:LacI family transcriptional regulator n=1 Tax=Periweissella fabalis TaxID=1070421 RepID=A0A7X6N243_9LACO|nr:LacI family DNA-binding transcriptional regulator [Periweissella fabalis]MCM0599406.1 LacI family DNA-binding transcriptional regulator [Periweissella fabalis]NKZ23685.1 LacI family transcriptional regulator [Periweissella fabalis]